MELLQPILVVVGLLAWFITKNRRWAILSVIGLTWFVLDIARLAAIEMGR